MGKRITVIGTINKDLILPFRGAPIESLGGIFYTTAILGCLMEPDDEIIPVSFLGEDLADTVRAALLPFKNVNSNALHSIPDKNQKVILEYLSPQERREKALFNFPPLEWKHVRNHLETDFIIVNLITGWDLSVGAFRKIVSRFGPKTYLDVHYLVKGIDSMGRRFPEKPQSVESWLLGPSFVQMNEEEFNIISDGQLDPVHFFGKRMTPDQTLLITRGRDGVTVIYQKDGMIRGKNIAAPQVSEVVDATGCGDAFGAGFVKAFSETSDVLESAAYANRVAAANAMLEGTNEISRLKTVMKTLSAQPQ